MSESRVLLCANFSLPRPLRSRLRPDVRDRQTSDTRRQTASSLNAPPIRGGGIITLHTYSTVNAVQNRSMQLVKTVSHCYMYMHPYKMSDWSSLH